ncbi:phage capsid protein, partial [Escherichia coli]|nr:phage capsid protein [Escherichia coli]
MENELIIDGQVIDLSETQENAEETIIQTESQPENESQDDNG